MLTGQASMPPVEGLPVLRPDLGPAGVGVPSAVMDEPEVDAAAVDVRQFESDAFVEAVVRACQSQPHASTHNRTHLG